MNTNSELCEYHRIEKKIVPEHSINVVSQAVCAYNEEYYQRTNCNGQRAMCAYPEKWKIN